MRYSSYSRVFASPFVRALGLIAFILVLILATERAALAQTDFILPGREPLVRAMLSTPVPLPGGCTFEGASIQKSSIIGRYTCSAGPLWVELSPPTSAANTEKFSVAIHDDKHAAPPAFQTALEAQIRANEKPWAWERQAQSQGLSEANSGDGNSNASSKRPWPYFALAGFLLFLASIRNRLAKREIIILGSLAAGSLLLRIVLGSFGPIHPNGQAPLWIAGAAQTPWLLTSYGPGYAELMGPIARWASYRADYAIFGMNVLMGAGSSVLAYGLGRLAGFGQKRSIVCGLLFAADPILVRIAATEVYLIPIQFLCIAAKCCMLMGVIRFQAGYRLRAILLLFAGAFCAAQAARIHPVALGSVVLVPLIALAAPLVHAGKQRLLAVSSASGALLLALGISFLTGWSPFAGAIEGHGNGIFTPIRYPFAYAGSGLLMVTLSILAPQRFVLLLLALVELTLIQSTHLVYGQAALWQAAFEHAHLSIIPLFFVQMIPEGWMAKRWWPVVTGAATTALLFAGINALRWRTTEELEYKWHRQWLQNLPSNCSILTLTRVGNRITHLPEYVLRNRSVFRSVRNPEEARSLAVGSCVLWVRSSICSSHDARDTCDSIERELGVRPFMSTSLPAVPSFDRIAYDRERVQLEVSDVTRRWGD